MCSFDGNTGVYSMIIWECGGLGVCDEVRLMCQFKSVITPDLLVRKAEYGKMRMYVVHDHAFETRILILRWMS